MPRARSIRLLFGLLLVHLALCWAQTTEGAASNRSDTTSKNTLIPLDRPTPPSMNTRVDAGDSAEQTKIEKQPEAKPTKAETKAQVDRNVTLISSSGHTEQGEKSKEDAPSETKSKEETSDKGGGETEVKSAASGGSSDKDKQEKVVEVSGDAKTTTQNGTKPHEVEGEKTPSKAADKATAKADGEEKKAASTDSKAQPMTSAPVNNTQPSGGDSSDTTRPVKPEGSSEKPQPTASPSTSPPPTNVPTSKPSPLPTPLATASSKPDTQPTSSPTSKQSEPTASPTVQTTTVSVAKKEGSEESGKGSPQDNPTKGPTAKPTSVPPDADPYFPSGSGDSGGDDYSTDHTSSEANGQDDYAAPLGGADGAGNGGKDGADQDLDDAYDGVASTHGTAEGGTKTHKKTSEPAPVDDGDDVDITWEVMNYSKKIFFGLIVLCVGCGIFVGCQKIKENRALYDPLPTSGPNDFDGFQMTRKSSSSVSNGIPITPDVIRIG